MFRVCNESFTLNRNEEVYNVWPIKIRVSLLLVCNSLSRML